MCSPLPQDDVFQDGSWLSAHEKFVAEAKDKEPDVLFFGDSLVALLHETDMYKDTFAPMHSLCFGLLGDSTSNLLWRIENGELECMQPKVVFISAGNCDRATSAVDVTSGVVKVAEAVAAKHAQATLYVLKLLPRGRSGNPRRELIAKVNEALPAALQAVPNAKALDIDPGFLAADGTMDAHDAWDYVHLTQEGYRKAFEMVHCTLISHLQPEL